MTLCTPRVVRVELLAAGQVAGPSYVGPREWPGAPVDVADGEPLRLATDALRVEATTRPLRLAFLDAAGAWLLREPPEGGMTVGPAGRLQARFQFSGEQHFYGLGQGGPGLDRLGVARQLWNTHLGHGPGSDMPCRSWSRAAATRSSSTTRATACSRWGARTTGSGSPTRPRPAGSSGTS